MRERQESGPYAIPRVSNECSANRGCVKQGGIKSSVGEENKQSLEAMGNQVCLPSQTLKYLLEDKWKKFIKNKSCFPSKMKQLV